VPAISCPGEVDIVADANTCGAIVNFSPAAAIDLEDGPLDVTQVSGPESGDLVEVGVYTVVFEATDSDGNTVTCDFTFEVEDTQDPVAMAQDITVSLDASGVAVITAEDLDGGSTDNCPDITFSIDTTTFDCGNVGIDNEVTLTVTDASGNTDTAIAIVTVIDDIAPEIACTGGSGFGIEVFINEIHYDNAGADENEAIEIAGPEGTNLEDWTLILYNGANGMVYHTENLTGIIPDQNNGFGTLNFPIEGIQNGAPDGIVLVDNTNTVVQFLSYEGVLVAEDGLAEGMTSQDIGVFEAGSTPLGESLQLTGTGSFYADFTWNSPATSSPGDVNSGQTFEEPVIGTIPQYYLDANGEVEIPITDLYLNATDNCSVVVSVGGASSGVCSQSNGGTVTNGSNNSVHSIFTNANDLIVPADQDFTLDQIVLQVLPLGASTDITLADVTYYEDNGGLPGAIIGSENGVVPTSDVVVGQTGAPLPVADINEVTLDLTPFTFAGQEGAETTYWISVS
ncbi:HYR domain-containing protein, partial [Planktosalinus lacus]|uniref:HYR domain-containing protein n=1 Tax=Planktosalinus lacus TaxID=1526573 RepID=UPI001664735F